MKPEHSIEEFNQLDLREMNLICCADILHDCCEETTPQNALLGVLNAAFWHVSEDDDKRALYRLVNEYHGYRGGEKLFQSNEADVALELARAGKGRVK
jgi:hypothetical protein